MGRLGRKRPEVPLHIGVAQVIGGQALLGPDEVLKLHRVADEEDGGVVANDVQVAFARIEPDREASRIAPRIGRSPLPCHGGETDQHIGLNTGLEDGRLRVGRYVVGGDKRTERATTFSVGLAFRDAFTIEIGHLLDQVEVLQEHRAVGTDGQRVLLAGHGDAGVRGGGWPPL